MIFRLFLAHVLVLTGVSCLFLCVAPFAHAGSAGSMTFTVTPPLFQISIAPGETWSSEITVVNSNPYDMTVYAEPVGFEPTGESGRPRFIHATRASSGVPVFEKGTSASWITAPAEGQLIVREGTVKIPFSLTVPSDAAPGGHYAAILIGNRPPDSGAREEGSVAVTSAIASLVLMRISGDVVERGRVREFVTERSVYERASARLSLRFENLGNVHLQPQGAITIYNMFGKKRGEIAVNQTNGFGNVLPNSIRSYAFTWDSDTGAWDIGRYRAEVTLGYGLASKQFAHATTYFWVLPVIPLIELFVAALLVFRFIAWAIRAYVRRALALERISSGEYVSVVPNTTASSDTMLGARPHDIDTGQALRLKTLVRPLRASMVDLRRVGGVSTPSDTHAVHPMEMRTFIRTYRSFFFFVCFGVVCILALRTYFSDVLTTERPFRATEERATGNQIELPSMRP